MVLSDVELAQILTDLQYLSPAKLQTAQTKATAYHHSLYDTLVQDDYLNEVELGKVIAYHYQLPYVALADTNVPEELLHLMPKSVAERFQTIPFRIDDNGLHIATAHPDATDLYTMLTKKVGAKQYQISYSPEPEIISALHMYKPELTSVLTKLLAPERQATPPINELIDALFEYAYDFHASDVHIEPQKDHTVVRFRIDGVLHDEAVLPKKLHEQL